MITSLNNVANDKPVKYNFSKLNDSGNYTIRKTSCIVFDLKRNES